MKSNKSQIPADEEIWLQVDDEIERLKKLAPIFAKTKKQIEIPSRDDLFIKKKEFLKQRIEQEKLKRVQEAEEVTKRKEADAEFLRRREEQGKPVVSINQLKLKHPYIVFLNEVENLTQEQLHDFSDFIEVYDAALALNKKITRVRVLGRNLLLEYLSQAYGIYRKITRAESGAFIFNELRATLQNKFDIKTHLDIPRPSILLKLIFADVSNKTINLYTRSFQFADANDIQAEDFPTFVRDLGGMEKIRKAYATVLAADRGELRPSYVKYAEDSASAHLLLSCEPNYVLQLTAPQASIFQNDILDRFCLIFARIDPMNQLEIYSQFPADKQLINRIIDKFTQVNKNKNNIEWHDQKRKVGLHKALQLEEKMALANKREQEKEAAAKKKEASIAKKNAATAKRFAKQAKNSVSTTTKMTAKVPAVKKTKK